MSSPKRNADRCGSATHRSRSLLLRLALAALFAGSFQTVPAGVPLDRVQRQTRLGASRSPGSGSQRPDNRSTDELAADPSSTSALPLFIGDGGASRDGRGHAPPAASALSDPPALLAPLASERAPRSVLFASFSRSRAAASGRAPPLRSTSLSDDV